MTIKRFRDSKRVRMAVFGDSITDEWITVSPKASGEDAPCWQLICRQILPGGASNVERQMSRLNADVAHLGVEDRPFSLFSKKTRLWDGSRVVARWDRDCHATEEVARLNLKTAIDLLEFNRIDALVIADYGKGYVTPSILRTLLNFAKERGTLVVVDPKNLSPADCEGATIVKANHAWAARFSAHDWKDMPIVVTDGPRGVKAQHRGSHFQLQPGRPTAPTVSTVGAGDCFTAHLAVALARGSSEVDAIRSADQAARNYVTRPFCEPLFPHEAEGRKAVHEDDAESVVRNRAVGKRVVAANGCFDVLHPGHVEMLRWAARQGDYLAVLVNDDDSVRRLKGTRRPAVDLEHRVRMLEALDCVDLVVPFSGDDPTDAIRKVGAVTVVKGSDHEGREVLHPKGTVVMIASPGSWSGHSSDLIGR